MGSYTSPSFAPVQLKEIADNTNSDGDILHDVHCTRFLTAWQTSPLWDGQIALKIELTDGTFANIRQDNSATDRLRSEGDAGANMGVIEAPAGKYPYHLRVVLVTAPTVGLCIAYLTYEKPPSNPLY